MAHSLSAWASCTGLHGPRCTLRPFSSPRPCQLRSHRDRATAEQARRRGCACRATEAEQKTAEPTAAEQEGTNWLPVIAPEDLPKGTRKEVNVAGEAVLLFWYRNEIFAIEARSPAEGAYSEGFIKSKLTQDYGIECPTTGSVFSLKTGKILVWYPSNPVLRLLTPQDTCRPLSVYPVRLSSEAIEVDVSSQVASGRSAKGMQQSQNNDVMVLETSDYVQGEEGEDTSDPVATTATFLSTTVALLGTAGAGTAVAIYKQSTTGLYVFWAFYLIVVGLLTVNYFRGNKQWL